MYIDVLERGNHVVIVPPLSSRSSSIAFYKSKSFVLHSVHLKDLPSYTLKFSHCDFILRPDTDRLLSFYNKKILNPHTLKKKIYRLRWFRFFYCSNISEFVKVLSKFNLYERLPSDKHLLLNKWIYLSIDCPNIKIIPFNRHIKRLSDKKININPSSRFNHRLKETVDERNQIRKLLHCYKLRMKNYFSLVVVSSRKCGSSFFYNVLNSNCNVSCSYPVKEINFFSDNFYKGFPWLDNLFIAKNSNWRIDVSPSYSFSLLNLRRIFFDNPKAHILMLTRKAENRSISHFKHLKNNRLHLNGSKYLFYQDEIIHDSSYEKIYSSILNVGFNKSSVHLLNADDFFVDHTIIKSFFQKNFGLDVKVNKNSEKYETFNIRFKLFYLTIRAIYTYLLRLNISFLKDYKRFFKNLFKTKSNALTLPNKFKVNFEREDLFVNSNKFVK